jgi:hypothetical protein
MDLRSVSAMTPATSTVLTTKYAHAADRAAADAVRQQAGRAGHERPVCAAITAMAIEQALNAI